ncbi:MAG: aldehyde dehydrogenase family protein [Chloroflexota bacterium]|nr:aldehyde dehydrogenase family protein [Chloroflexota bacterium]
MRSGLSTEAPAALPRLRSYVGGTWRDGGEAVPDTNPSHPREKVAEAFFAQPAVALEAVHAAAAAQLAWRATPAPARGEILRCAADLLDQRSAAIARDLTREEGKTLAESIGETKRAIGILRYYAAQTLEPDGETYASHSPATFLYARREPLGVVVAITPWNFPIAIPAVKIAPALAYGNTVVWKPAGIVPLTAVHFLMALIDAGLPPGVLNLVLGRGSDIGEILTTSPEVDAITFTGSNATGRAIQLRAITAGKRVQMELGGKNPAVVLADADLGHAAEQVARGAFLSAGQKCTATSRVIVEKWALPEFAERLVQVARDWKLGDPLDADTKVGPLASRDQMDKVMGYIKIATEHDAQVLAGGDAATGLGDGYFVKPTVLAGVPADSRVAREEIFGPVAVLLEAGSFEDSIAMANDTEYGLTASIFTRDLDKALRFARDIRTGVVKVNQETAGYELHAPSGGMKESGSGSREYGKAPREFFTEWKTVYMDRPPAG